MPPLILHPFSSPPGPERVLESSRANLMLQGVIPMDTGSREELQLRLLEGRLDEIRMLYYVGKDLSRWTGQCVEFAERQPELADRELREQSFIELLTENPPEPVKAKFVQWGVVNHRTLFCRAAGLHGAFATVPEPGVLSPEFLLYYYRYADHLYACRQQMTPFEEITAAEFEFDLYASWEYSRMLEREWQEGE